MASSGRKKHLSLSPFRRRQHAANARQFCLVCLNRIVNKQVEKRIAEISSEFLLMNKAVREDMMAELLQKLILLVAKEARNRKKAVLEFGLYALSGLSSDCYTSEEEASEMVRSVSGDGDPGGCVNSELQQDIRISSDVSVDTSQWMDESEDEEIPRNPLHRGPSFMDEDLSCEEERAQADGLKEEEASWMNLTQEEILNARCGRKKPVNLFPFRRRQKATKARRLCRVWIKRMVNKQVEERVFELCSEIHLMNKAVREDMMAELWIELSWLAAKEAREREMLEIKRKWMNLSSLCEEGDISMEERLDLVDLEFVNSDNRECAISDVPSDDTGPQPAEYEQQQNQSISSDVSIVVDTSQWTDESEDGEISRNSPLRDPSFMEEDLSCEEEGAQEGPFPFRRQQKAPKAKQLCLVWINRMVSKQVEKRVTERYSDFYLMTKAVREDMMAELQEQLSWLVAKEARQSEMFEIKLRWMGLSLFYHDFISMDERLDLVGVVKKSDHSECAISDDTSSQPAEYERQQNQRISSDVSIVVDTSQWTDESEDREISRNPLRRDPCFMEEDLSCEEEGARGVD